MREAKQMRLVGHTERIPGPTFIGPRGHANEMLSMADGRLDEIVGLEALSRFDESGDQSGAAVDDVQPLRLRRQFRAGQQRGASALDKILPSKRRSRLNTGLRDA